MKRFENMRNGCDREAMARIWPLVARCISADGGNDAVGAILRFSGVNKSIRASVLFLAEHSKISKTSHTCGRDDPILLRPPFEDPRRVPPQLVLVAFRIDRNILFCVQKGDVSAEDEAMLLTAAGVELWMPRFSVRGTRPPRHSFRVARRLRFLVVAFLRHTLKLFDPPVPLLGWMNVAETKDLINALMDNDKSAVASNTTLKAGYLLSQSHSGMKELMKRYDDEKKRVEWMMIYLFGLPYNTVYDACAKHDAETLCSGEAEALPEGPECLPELPVLPVLPVLIEKLDRFYADVSRAIHYRNE